MYKAVVRMLIRRNIRELNEGRYHPALAMFAPDAELSFPGDTTWSHQYRGPDGNDLYSNRAVLMVRTAWGKIRSQEDYEDTERVSAFDASRPTTAALETQ
jgi:ketosteroid isomerase-like protein